MQRKPPGGAPEGTVWFGGPVDRFKITLRIIGDDLDPERISSLLRCTPTGMRRGDPTKGADGCAVQWFLEIRSEALGESYDLEDGIKLLLEKLPSDRDLWVSLTSAYTVDLFCGIFLGAANRGFGISPEVSRMLADRGIEVGFDIYCPE